MFLTSIQHQKKMQKCMWGREESNLRPLGWRYNHQPSTSNCGVPYANKHTKFQQNPLRRSEVMCKTLYFYMGVGLLERHSRRVFGPQGPSTNPNLVFARGSFLQNFS